MSAKTSLSEAAERLKPVLSALPPADRLGLADFLYDSVEMMITAEEYQGELEAELIRRITETEAGLGGEVSGDEMRRIAREAIKK